ncbi:MAG: methionyl-tRNA formyltransferase [Bacteroidales bacterium]|jgi:methionyl-tRNA formyltransferase|nr:methionyl-tRNA formyltransferase [Bacteroidales bacterium]NLP21018.1 methionyl-tRNA formyltransferase [Bacteroidales bacterium]OQC46513.1 MAG: Methionyl-tRNA formyltransferase [Bacteroidetes bacterium ADurb.Bin028]
MGTPGFAVEPLKQLLEDNQKILAIITAPDKPAGRGKKISESEVKTFAKDLNIKILQPTNLKYPDFISELKSLNADLFVVVAFRMLPKEVWQIPKFGTINLHASLLPDYRGAAPINHAILNGDTETGLTTFFINEEIDTGNIIFQTKCEILESDNAGTLHDKLMNLGGKLLVKTVNSIANGTAKSIEQDSLKTDKLRQAPKLNKEFCKLDFNNSAEELHNKVRALSPYPAAWFELTNTENTIKVFETSYEINKHNLEIGKIISDNKNEIKIAVKDGFLLIHELQMSGKKRMKTKDFLNGYKF